MRLDLLELRRDAASLRLDLLRERRILARELRSLHALVFRAYDPDQPRVPAGAPGGGQWTDGGGGGSGLGGGSGEPGRPVVRADPDPLSPVQSVAQTRRADGSLAEESVILRDGSRIESRFGTPDQGTLERHRIELPDGETRVFETEGRTQTIRDGAGTLLARTTWTETGPEPEAIAQPAFAPAVPAAAAGIRAGMALYTWMSAKNGPDGQAIVAFKARDYQPTEDGKDLAFVGRLQREEVEQVCRRLSDVQQMTDEAARKAGDRRNFSSAATYGTAVHTELKKLVDKDSSLVGEVSLLKSRQADREQAVRYGQPGSLRIDVLHLQTPKLACLFDGKTGREGLHPGRAGEMAYSVWKHFGLVERIIATEVRPSR